MSSNNRGGTGDSPFRKAQQLWEEGLASKKAMEDRDPTTGDLYHWPMPFGLPLRWLLGDSDRSGRVTLLLLDEDSPWRREREPMRSPELEDEFPWRISSEFLLEVEARRLDAAHRVGRLTLEALQRMRQAIRPHEGPELDQEAAASRAEAASSPRTVPPTEEERRRLPYDPDEREYLLALRMTHGALQHWLDTGSYRIPVSTFAEAGEATAAMTPALAAASTSTWLEEMRRALSEDTGPRLDLGDAFPADLQVLVTDGGVTLLHDAGEEGIEPPVVESLDHNAPCKLEWQRDASGRWSRLLEIQPWQQGSVHLALTQVDGETFRFEIYDDRS